MSRFKFLCTVPVLVLLCLSLAQTRTYTIGMIHWAAYSPLNVASQKGFWEGVDVRIVELEPETIADNFISDRFSVIVNYDPQALGAEREGNGTVVATSASYEGCIPGCLKPFRRRTLKRFSKA